MLLQPVLNKNAVWRLTTRHADTVMNEEQFLTVSELLNFLFYLVNDPLQFLWHLLVVGIRRFHTHDCCKVKKNKQTLFVS